MTGIESPAKIKRSNPNTLVTTAHSPINVFPNNGSVNKPTTFKVFDVSPNKIKGKVFSAGQKHASNSDGTGKDFSEIRKLECFDDSYLSQIVHGSESYNRTISKKHIKSVRNGFVDTIISAYMGHQNLILRPDDVWLAIMTQFSFFVNANAKKLRKHFVDFKGQKTLVVVIMEPTVKQDLESTPFELFISKMTELVDKNLVDSEVKNWVLPNFSTTTPDDRITVGVALMATMKNYFKYRGTRCICGIPNVTLEGSVEDWTDIRNRIEKLREYDMGQGVDMLGPILDQFIRAKSGDIDVEFWKNICHHDFHKGTGAYSPDRTYISGWVTAFCLLTKDGEWQPQIPKFRSDKTADRQPKFDLKLKWPHIEIKHIAVGYVDVEVKFNCHGKKYSTVMIAGHMATEVSPDRLTLRPSSGWVVVKKEEEKK